MQWFLFMYSKLCTFCFWQCIAACALLLKFNSKLARLNAKDMNRRKK